MRHIPAGTRVGRVRCPPRRFSAGWAQEQQQQPTDKYLTDVPATAALPRWVCCDSSGAQDVLYMQQALHMAREAFDCGEVPVGAVLVAVSEGGVATVLAAARNGVEGRHDATAHAEMECIRSACAQLGNWRLNRRGSAAADAVPWRTILYSTLEPCAMCLSALQLARVTELVYGARDMRLGAVESYMRLLQHASPHPFHQLERVRGGVLAAESAALLRAFFRQRRQASISAMDV